MSDQVPAGIGHNKPPPLASPVTDIANYLLEEEAALLRRRGELQDGLKRFQAKCPTIEDDETYGLAGDFKLQVQGALRVCEEHFKAVKQPFTDGGRAIDSFFNALRAPLNAILSDVNKPMTAYAERKAEAERARRAEVAREAAEEARRAQEALAAGRPEATIETAIVHAQAADRAQKAAAAPAADMTRGRGDYGSVSSLREVWDVELTDLSLVPLEFLTFNDAAARKAVQGGKRKQIPGVRVFTRRHVVTR